jgi:hypothetical protein
VRFTKGENGKKRTDPKKKKPQAGKSKKKSKISVEKKFQITNKIP